jgi:hypothetical protein
MAAHPNGLKTPICLEGENAWPPEDCGGIDGFEEIKKALKSKRSKKNAELLEWVGDYNPLSFSEIQITKSLVEYWSN